MRPVKCEADGVAFATAVVEILYAARVDNHLLHHAAAHN
jgi:hypothetical protein